MNLPLTYLLLLSLAAPNSLIDRAQKAIETFRVKQGLRLLDKARHGGPYKLSDHVRLYEQYAIAFAYLDRREEALRAFDMLLALSPGHAIRYTLSPKVTLLFEEARRRARERRPPQIEVILPRRPRVSDRLPIDIEVLADDRQLLAHATLFWRLRGQRHFRHETIPLRGPGNTTTISLPPVAASATSARTVELHLVAYDPRGNEVYHWHSERGPRELTLSYVPPDHWYGKWWIWALAGTAVAASVGAAVFATTREPATQVDATAEVLR